MCGRCDAMTNTEGSQRAGGHAGRRAGGQNDADARPGERDELVQRSSRTTPARVCRVTREGAELTRAVSK
jgi:hypothetical protein